MDELPTTLYLAQHGESKPEADDPARPLTDRGREEVTRVARAAARARVAVLAIRHSGKLRAQQTADLFAAELRPAGGVHAMEGLAPNDDPQIALRGLRTMELPVLLVGHLPHLSRLAGVLLAGDERRELIGFRMGGLVRLELRGESDGHVRWILTPDVIVQRP